MANTFKFGNENWATRKETVLAYNDENNNFKPLPFTFDRGSIATVVNKEGLIETVGIDEPRIDFLNNSKGHLLLEPTRTNLMQRSGEFDNSYWTKARSSITANQTTSPDGSNTADKLIDSTDNNTHIVYRSFTVSTSNAYTFSCFLKKGSLSKAFLAFDAAIGQTVVFDLENGTVESEGTGVTSSSIVEYSNDWYKCTLTHTPTTTTRLYRVGTYNGSISYTGTGTDFVYLWGAQLEEGSYATSYIPTSGSAVTRSAETANGAGNSNVFNDSEGVLYAEISALANDGTTRRFSISDGTNDNRVLIGYSSSSRFQFVVSDGGSVVVNKLVTVSDIALQNKVAFKYKLNDCAIWINGYEVDTDTVATMPSGLDTLNFDQANGTEDFYGKVKDVRLYNTALSDSELQALTSN